MNGEGGPGETDVKVCPGGGGDINTDSGHELVMLVQTQAMRGALRRVGRRISYTVTFYTLIHTEAG